MKSAKVFVLFLSLGSGLASAQGPLTPPGAPAPTMKSLDQIEARTPIPVSPAVPVAGPHFTISTPGSYYLTGNVTVASGDAIRITSDDVTLDLNGFKISSSFPTGSSGRAINPIGDRVRLTVRNGSIVSGATVSPAGAVTAAGFHNGIYSDNTIKQVLIENIHLSGMAGDGMFLDGQAVVQNCVAKNCGGAGIVAQEVSNCLAEMCALGAISARNITNCTGISIGGIGIFAVSNVMNCVGTSTNTTGLNCGGNAFNSIGTSTSGPGLICGQNASNCVGITSTTTPSYFGLHVNGTASFCRGQRLGGTAIQAAIAIGCTTVGGSVDSPQKFLGTP